MKRTSMVRPHRQSFCHSRLPVEWSTESLDIERHRRHVQVKALLVLDIVFHNVEHLDPEGYNGYYTLRAAVRALA